jgi:hypothetical protein
MNVVFPDAGLVPILTKIVGTGLIYNLYINDVTPGVGSVLGDFQIANWSGYASVMVPAAAWSLQVVEGDVGKFQADAILFFNSSPGDRVTYGYYVTDSSGTNIVAAARFDLAPVTIRRGDAYPVLPLLGVYSGSK